MGMHQFFQGRASAALVENFAPASVDAVTFAGDGEPGLLTTLLVCQSCYMDKPVDLPMLMERQAAAARRAEEKADAVD
jgi:hypothetical protein